jgi:hypothetical protein
MTDAKVGAMVESLFACRADASSGIMLKDVPTDRVLAGDAHAIGTMFKPIQCGTQLVELWIGLERQECIDLVKIQTTIGEKVA